MKKQSDIVTKEMLDEANNSLSKDLRKEIKKTENRLDQKIDRLEGKLESEVDRLEKMIHKNYKSTQYNGVMLETIEGKLDMALEILVGNQDAIRTYKEKWQQEEDHIQSIPSIRKTVRNHSKRLKKLEAKAA